MHSGSLKDGLESKKDFKHRLWPLKGFSTSRPDDRRPLDTKQRAMAVGTESSPSVHKYSAYISAPPIQESGWTPLTIAEDGRECVQLQDFGGIRVDREIDVSQPENAYHQI